MVAAGTLIEPLNAVADKRIRTRSRRHVRRTLWHVNSLCHWDGVAVRPCAAANASLRIRAQQGIGCIGVLAKRRVIGLAADIGHRQHQVASELALYREAPLLVSGREQVGV